MKRDKGKFDHLLNNLEMTSNKYSIFNYKSGRRAFLSLSKRNTSEWLEMLLPNTRLIIEPNIIGLSIGIQYIDGNLNKAINRNSDNITKEVSSLRSVPKCIPIKKRIEIRGVLYDSKHKSYKNNKTEFLDNRKASRVRNQIKFCAFQILHCKVNHYQALQELKKLNFEIPETQYTNFISDIEIYRKCWEEGKLFTNYPTSGIVVKINSKKLQKRLGENNISKHWACTIN